MDRLGLGLVNLFHLLKINFANFTVKSSRMAASLLQLHLYPFQLF